MGFEIFLAKTIKHREVWILSMPLAKFTFFFGWGFHFNTFQVSMCI